MRIVAAMAIAAFMSGTVGLGRGAKVPRFNGNRQERYIQAVDFYTLKMGIDNRYGFDFQKENALFCAWVANASGEDKEAVVFGFSIDDPYRVEYKPETLALHEVCHVKLRHLWSNENPNTRHNEIEPCMYAWDEDENN